MGSLQSNLDIWRGLRPAEAPKTDWRGLEEQSDSQRMARTAVGVGLVYGAHQTALERLPNYAARAYDFARNAENRFPGKILKTFGMSQILSRHLPGDIRLTSGQLVKGVYGLSGERHVVFND